MLPLSGQPYHHHSIYTENSRIAVQQGQSRADFVAAFQRAEALKDDMSVHAGAYGEGLVAAALAAQGQARPGTAEKPGVEGRKELEGDDSSSGDTSTSTAAPVNSGGMSTGEESEPFPWCRLHGHWHQHTETSAWAPCRLSITRWPEAPVMLHKSFCGPSVSCIAIPMQCQGIGLRSRAHCRLKWRHQRQQPGRHDCDRPLQRSAQRADEQRQEEEYGRDPSGERAAGRLRPPGHCLCGLGLIIFRHSQHHQQREHHRS